MTEKLFLMVDVAEARLPKIQAELIAEGFKKIKIAKQESGSWAVAACECQAKDDDA